MISIIRNRSIAFKLVFFILSSCAIIFAGIFAYNYGVSRGMLIEKIEAAAESLVSGTAHNIETKILPAEKVPEYLSIAMANPEVGEDDIMGFIRSALEKNPEIYGSTIAFEPYKFEKELYSYSPYLYKDGSEIKYADLGADSYNYFNWDWYKVPKELGHPVWSEPYYDKGGGDTLMVTYSAPFYREEGGKKKFAGIVTADLSLSWLEEMVSSLKIGKTGYGFLVSKEGKLITHPDKSLVMKESVLNMNAAKNGSALHLVGRAMPKGKTGFTLTTDPATRKKVWIAYAPVTTTGWSLAAVFQETELMEDLYNLNRVVLIVGIIGLLFLAAVIVLFANSITKPLKVLALTTRNIAKGNLDFDLPDSDSKDEVGSLAQSLQYMKTELKSYIERLTRTTREKEKIESELKIASSIQLGTLPRVIPPYTGRDEFEIYAAMKPAKEVGGDFYDFYFIDDEHLAFTIGDVSGKGVPAAIYMATAKTYIHSLAKTIKEPEEVLQGVNEELSRDNVSAMFVTVFFGILNIKTGEVRYANAGHNPPLVIRKHQDPEFFKENGGCVLGAFEDAPMGGGTIKFQPGDILFMYTDGVTEAINIKREEFSDERLKERLTAHKDDPIKKMAEATLSGIEDFSRGAPQSDDITILVLGYFGKDGHDRRGSISLPKGTNRVIM